MQRTLDGTNKRNLIQESDFSSKNASLGLKNEQQRNINRKSYSTWRCTTITLWLCANAYAEKRIYRQGKSTKMNHQKWQRFLCSAIKGQIFMKGGVIKTAVFV